VKAARVKAARVKAARVKAARVKAARVKAARVKAARVEAAPAAFAGRRHAPFSLRSIPKDQSTRLGAPHGSPQVRAQRQAHQTPLIQLECTKLSQ